MLKGKCPYCGLIMDENTDSCEFDQIKVNDKWYSRKVVSYGGETLGKRCRECSTLIAPKNHHHYGCPNEECPQCWRTIINCTCNKQELKKGDKIRIIEKNEEEHD